MTQPNPLRSFSDDEAEANIVAQALYECDPSQDDTPWERLLEDERARYRHLADNFIKALDRLMRKEQPS